MSGAKFLGEAVRVHDALVDRGLSDQQIVGILGAGMGFSLLMMTPAQRVLALRDHLAELAEMGIDISDLVRQRDDPVGFTP